MRLSPTQREIALSALTRHIVCLDYIAEKPNEPSQHGIASGFVIALSGEWFLVTAGHLSTEVDGAKAAGYQIKWHLNDVAFGSKHDIAIPFDFDGAAKVMVDDRSLGLDCAAIHLRMLYRANLQANGIVAMDEDVWGTPDPHLYDSICLVGAPREFLLRERVDSVTGDIDAEKSLLLIEVAPNNDPPDQLRTIAPRFYGRIAEDLRGEDGSRLMSIIGMSGGPIFGLTRDDQANARYFVIAIQNGWLPDSHDIAACPFVPFAQWLGDHIAEALSPVTQE